MATSPNEAVELVRGDIAAFVRTLKSEADAPIWLCGDADVAFPLMGAGLADHVVVKLNPVVFGSGIPLFKSTVGQTALALGATTVYDAGIVLLRYDV